MRLKLYHVPAMVVLFVCAAYSTLAQIAPAATQSSNHFAAGVGVSGYDLDDKSDYLQGFLLGGTLWIDYKLPFMPGFLSGLGLEAEARDLNYGRFSAISTNLRMDTASGGMTYHLNHYVKFHPYGKYMMGFGNVDYGKTPNPITSHPFQETRTITSVGGGVDYRISQNLWARAEYEYQFWPNFWKQPITHIHGPSLTPQGLSVGVMYHFNHRH
jgi:opacity protein-like surface antigen